VFLDLIEADLNGVIAPPSPQMFLRQKQYKVANDDEFDESVSAPAAAPAAAPETPDRLDTLLELLGGAGEALPSFESPDVPWAELLQQRMAGAKQRIAGPVQSVRIAQQRGQPIGAQGPGVLQQRLQRIQPIGAQSIPAGSPGTLLAGTLAASASLGNFRQQRLRRYGTSVEAGGRLAALSPRGSRLAPLLLRHRLKPPSRAMAMAHCCVAHLPARASSWHAGARHASRCRARLAWRPT